MSPTRRSGADAPQGAPSRPALDRRGFLKASSATAATVLLVGCADQGAAPAEAAQIGADASAPDSATSEAGASTNADGRLDNGQRDARGQADGRPATCGELTKPNIEGPFFSPSSPQRSNLRESGMAGTPLLIAGRVLGTDCTPIPGALLDFWQANQAGAYDTNGFTLRGHQFASRDGGFRLETIIPGRYLNGDTYRPAHIHVKVGGQATAVLTTQLYFKDDPFNSADPWILPSLIMTPRDGAGGVKLASFDFVLARA